MTPLIKSGQKHILSPVSLDDVEVGDIVFCKVKGRYYTHLVKAKGGYIGEISKHFIHLEEEKIPNPRSKVV